MMLPVLVPLVRFGGQIIVEYNTEWRSDHSTRYEKLAPFELLTMVESNHMWHSESIQGLRVVKPAGSPGYLTEVAIKYRGRCQSPPPPARRQLFNGWGRRGGRGEGPPKTLLFALLAPPPPLLC